MRGRFQKRPLAFINCGLLRERKTQRWGLRGWGNEEEWTKEEILQAIVMVDILSDILDTELSDDSFWYHSNKKKKEINGAIFFCEENIHLPNIFL